MTAIVVSHLGGNEVGNSLVDILYGAYNPSGKLPYTIAYNESDYFFANITTAVENSTDPNAWQSDFKEKLLIDYRYFDYHNISVRYPFGFGLSYTTFDLSDLVIVPSTNQTISALPTSNNVTTPGGKEELWQCLFQASATISNTGNSTGATVPQLYITLPSTAGQGTPIKQLRGFEKIKLAAGTSEIVKFDLMRRDISFWDVVMQEWRVPKGTFEITLGFSSRDSVLVGSFEV